MQCLFVDNLWGDDQQINDAPQEPYITIYNYHVYIYILLYIIYRYHSEAINMNEIHANGSTPEDIFQ